MFYVLLKSTLLFYFIFFVFSGREIFPARELKGKDFIFFSPALIVAPSAVRIDGLGSQDTSGFNSYAPLIEVLQILWIFFFFLAHPLLFVVFHGSMVASVGELGALSRR